MEKKKGMSVSVRSFVTAIIVIFVLMIAAYVLTLLIPGGAYVRTEDANGNLIIAPDAAFERVEGGIPLWK